VSTSLLSGENYQWVWQPRKNSKQGLSQARTVTMEKSPRDFDRGSGVDVELVTSQKHNDHSSRRDSMAGANMGGTP
jgi:hypothetical protein